MSMTEKIYYKTVSYNFCMRWGVRGGVRKALIRIEEQPHLFRRLAQTNDPPRPNISLVETVD